MCLQCNRSLGVHQYFVYQPTGHVMLYICDECAYDYGFLNEKLEW